MDTFLEKHKLQYNRLKKKSNSRECFPPHFMSQCYSDTKTKQRHHRKMKGQTNSPYEYRCRNIQENTSNISSNM